MPGSWRAPVRGVWWRGGHSRCACRQTKCPQVTKVQALARVPCFAHLILQVMVSVVTREDVHRGTKIHLRARDRAASTNSLTKEQHYTPVHSHDPSATLQYGRLGCVVLMLTCSKSQFRKLFCCKIHEVGNAGNEEALQSVLYYASEC